MGAKYRLLLTSSRLTSIAEDFVVTTTPTPLHMNLNPLPGPRHAVRLYPKPKTVVSFHASSLAMRRGVRERILGVVQEYTRIRALDRQGCCRRTAPYLLGHSHRSVDTDRVYSGYEMSLAVRCGPSLLVDLGYLTSGLRQRLQFAGSLHYHGSCTRRVQHTPDRG